MNTYGKIFKELRQSKNLTLKDLADSRISISQLSRFENGESSITLEKMIHVLDRLNISLEEFMHLANGFKTSHLQEILKKLQHLVIEKDTLALKGLLQEENEAYTRDPSLPFHRLNAILIATRLQDIDPSFPFNPEELAFLSDYFFSIEIWGCYELLLFGNTVDLFEYKTFFVLTKEMLRKSDYYSGIEKYRKVLSSILLNAYLHSIEMDELINAAYFEKKIEEFYFDEREIFGRVIFLYAKGFYQYKLTGESRWILEMRKAIGVLKSVGSHNHAKWYENHLARMLENKQ